MQWLGVMGLKKTWERRLGCGLYPDQKCKPMRQKLSEEAKGYGPVTGMTWSRRVQTGNGALWAT